MPTGYTAAIKEGIPFETFVLGCARAFGALIDMRDEPFDAPIPQKFEASLHHKNRLDEINLQLEQIKKMSIGEISRKARSEYEQAIEDSEKGIRNNNELRAKYNNMLTKVRNWQPPTLEHEELKKFMIDQIEESINFDCNNDYYLRNTLRFLNGEDWGAKQILKLLKDLDYHTREWQKEKQRVAERTYWIETLRTSLFTKES